MNKLFFIILLFTWPSYGQDTIVLNTKLPFPTAYGAGSVSTTTGGGAGTLYFVTSLDASQATSGSLKWAMNQASPKRIIPMVSGKVNYVSQYKDGRSQSEADDWTYYGHLAPQGGLEIYTGGMYYEYIKNIIVRGIKARGRVSDGDNICFDRGENIIIDHASTAFSDGGESIDVSGNTDTPYKNGDITVQHSLISQSNNGLIMGDSGGSNSDGNSVYANIFVNVGWRFPKAGGSIDLDVYNNGIHNWTARMIRMDSYDYTVNLIGNYWQKGSNTKNRDNDNLNKTYPKESEPYPQIYNFDNAFSELPPSGFPADQDNSWQLTDPVTPIGFYDVKPDASHFTDTKNTNTWREFPLMSVDSVKTMILDRVGATFYVDDTGTRGRYYDATEQDAYDTFDQNTQEDNTAWSYQDSSIPENTRGGGYDTDNDGLPQWFETEHSVSTTDEVKEYYTFSHYGTDETYVVQNDAEYGALDIFSAWVLQDFEFLLDVGNIDGDTTYSIIDGEEPEIVAVTGLEWDDDDQTVDVGGFLDLSVTWTPSNATDKGFGLVSSDTDVVSNAGAVIGEGTATLTITADDTTNGTISDVMSVTVNVAVAQPPIMARGGFVKINGVWTKIKTQ